MLVVFIRALVLYMIVVVTMRIMGKRQIGQLQPFELAIAIMISELAAVPMQNTGIPLINGIIPILTLLLAQLLMSFLSMKSIRARTLICGTPSILIERGRIVERELRKEMFTLSDLLEQLRIKNVANIADVEFAILETNGQLSVIPKSQKRPLNPEDMKLPIKYEGLALDLIVDGQINNDNLLKSGHNEMWLQQQINKLGFTEAEDILLASLDSNDQMYCQPKSKKEL